MAFDRRVVLRQPGIATQNSFGDVIPGTPTDHPVMAEREDTPGDEGIAFSAEVYTQRSRWRIRRYPAIAGLDPSWALVDDDGNVTDILAVEEAPGPRRRFWRIVSRRAG